MNEIIEITTLQERIFTIRGKRVMIDRDLAELYGVETKRLNEAVKRNIKRFPQNFMFQLTKEEFEVLRSQFATTKNIDKNTEKRGGRQYLPYAFTEHGVTMLASVLNSDRAIEISIKIVETFIALRQFALENKELTKQVQELQRCFINYCKENEIDKQEIQKAIDLLMDRTKPIKIGFNTDK